MKAHLAEAAAKIQFGIARECDFKDLTPDDIKAIKSDDSVTHYRFVERGAKADPSDEENMTVVHIASSEHVDSMGDVIIVNGWDTVRLKLGKIPLIPGHNPEPIPLGLVLSAKRGKCDDGVKCLETKSRFHEQELYADSEWGKHVQAMRTLVLRGDMPGVSVGFVPKKYHWPDQEERDTRGMAGYGIVFEEQELLELSVTPIPANNRAQQRKSSERVRSALCDLVATGKLSKEAAEALEPDLVMSEDAWVRRATALSRTVVSIGDHSWVRGARAASSTPPPAQTVDLTAIVERIGRDAAAAARKEAFAVTREILEPLEDAIHAATEHLERAATRLGVRTDHSERAEVSDASAPNGASPATAESTGTSRETPTQPTRTLGAAAAALLRAVDATTGGTDSAQHGSQADHRSEGARG